ncbi:MAG TPA: hypothetical protein VMV59_12150 [Candidatus Dormibacteraeota bacterium]|nr:hypothetical protein [Candidatus Dormibacteraeota bacterium]
MRVFADGREIAAGRETTQDAALHRATIDDVKRSLADLSARIDRWNERRKQSDAALNPASHAERLRAMNEANAKFWRARG